MHIAMSMYIYVVNFSIPTTAFKRFNCLCEYTFSVFVSKRKYFSSYTGCIKKMYTLLNIFKLTVIYCSNLTAV